MLLLLRGKPDEPNPEIESRQSGGTSGYARG